MDKVRKSINNRIPSKFNPEIKLGGISDNLRSISINESLISMILGALVVVLIGLLAYNYFRSQKQTVPVTNTTVSQTNSEDSTNNSGEITNAQNAVALPTTHTVATGENLWSIAEKYYRSGYNYVDIAKVNNLANPNSLEVGQKLTIPNTEVRQPLTTAGNTPVITVAKINDNSYVTMKGDTLWDIAVRAYGDGYRFGEIAKVNNLANPNLIHSGVTLAIPR